MKKQVLVIDSDDRQIQRIVSVLKETAVQTGNRMDIYVSNTLQDAETVMEEIEIDVLILDTVYRGMSLEDYPGIKWVQNMRENEKYILLPVIFVSSIAEPRLEAYRRSNCLGFLPRQFKADELHRVLEKAMHHTTLKDADKNFLVKTQGSIYPIQIKDILYVEVLNRILYIYQKNGLVLKIPHKPLRDFQTEVDSKWLIQCNKSMLVNTLYVKAMNEEVGFVSLVLDDIQLLVGKKYVHSLRTALKRTAPKYILK